MRSNTNFLKLVLLLSLIGVLVSGKLLSIHNRFTTGQATLTESCSIGGGHGCIDVAVSDYSVVFGIPLAAIALGYYFTQLILGFWALKNQQAANEPMYVSFFLATLAVVVTVTMFVISNYILKQFCQWCAMLWVVNLAIWPCLVKQLGLGWGNALAANFELLGKGKLSLRRERIWGSLGAGIACVLIASVIGLVSKAGEAQENPQGQSRLLEDYAKAPMVMLSADAYGGPLSKGLQEGTPVMEIAELADFQCPGCKMAAQSLKPFLIKHGNKVRLTFHNFPLDGSCNPFVPHGMHAIACALARGGICAGKQNKFWDYHDFIYDRQGEGQSLAMMEEIAQTIGLDMNAFQSCLKDPATEMQLQKDMRLGELVNLESTPTLIVNGRKLIGSRPPSEFEALLRTMENEQKK